MGNDELEEIAALVDLADTLYPDDEREADPDFEPEPEFNNSPYVTARMMDRASLTWDEDREEDGPPEMWAVAE